LNPKFDSWQIYFYHISFLFLIMGVRSRDSSAERLAVEYPIFWI